MIRLDSNSAAMVVCTLSLWERVGVRGYGLSRETTPHPPDFATLRRATSPHGRGERHRRPSYSTKSYHTYRERGKPERMDTGDPRCQPRNE
jgi:hypothetical protein